MGDLFISEVFESIQGETSFTGCLTSFIRLAGCPLRCTWCDSAFTYKQGEKKTFTELLDLIQQFGWQHICVTGGEPLAQPNCIKFLTLLIQHAYCVSLETNGTLSIKEVPEKVHTILDIKCPGSGMAEHTYWPNLEFLRPNHEVKFVIADKSDFTWALSIIDQHSLLSKGVTLLMSPAWNLLDPKELVSWMLQTKMPLRLNIQAHKYVCTR